MPVGVLGLIAEYLCAEDYVSMAGAVEKTVPYGGNRWDRISVLCDKTHIRDLPNTYGLTFWVGKTALYKEFVECYDFIAKAEELPESLTFAQLPPDLLNYASDDFLKKYGKNFNPAAAIALRKFLAVDFDENWRLAANMDDFAFFSHFRLRITEGHIKSIENMGGTELAQFIRRILRYSGRTNPT